MKRIIRLTESDLARIVRRVISEGTETTTMTPEEYITLNMAGRNISFQTKSGKDTFFKITPGKYSEKDNKGNQVVKPRHLRLDISHESGLGATLVVNCDSGGFLKRLVSKPADLTAFDSNYKGSLGTATETMVAWKGDYFDKKGAVAEMITNFCPKV